MAIHYHSKWHNMFAQTVCWIRRLRDRPRAVWARSNVFSAITFLRLALQSDIRCVLGSVHPRIFAKQKLYSEVSFAVAVAFHLSFFAIQTHSRSDRISHVFRSLYLLKLCARDIVISHLICSVVFFFLLTQCDSRIYLYRFAAQFEA